MNEHPFRARPIAEVLGAVSQQLGMDNAARGLALLRLWPQVLETVNAPEAVRNRSHALRYEAGKQQVVIGAADGATAAALAPYTEAMAHEFNSYQPATGLVVKAIRVRVAKRR